MCIRDRSRRCQKHCLVTHGHLHRSPTNCPIDKRSGCIQVTALHKAPYCCTAFVAERSQIRLSQSKNEGCAIEQVKQNCYKRSRTLAAQVCQVKQTKLSNIFKHKQVGGWMNPNHALLKWQHWMIPTQITSENHERSNHCYVN